MTNAANFGLMTSVRPVGQTGGSAVPALWLARRLNEPGRFTATPAAPTDRTVSEREPTDGPELAGRANKFGSGCPRAGR